MKPSRIVAWILIATGTLALLWALVGFIVPGGTMKGFGIIVFVFFRILLPTVASKISPGLCAMQLPVLPTNPAELVVAPWVAADHVVAPFVFLYWCFTLQTEIES